MYRVLRGVYGVYKQTLVWLGRDGSFIKGWLIFIHLKFFSQMESIKISVQGLY